MVVTARRIRSDEALRLREVRLAALAEAPQAFSTTLGEMVDQPVAFWVDRAQASAAGDLAATFIADMDGTWVAMVAGYRAGPDQPFVELVSMWVAPAARGRGVGQLLVRQITDWAAEIDVPRVGLWVMNGNDAAVALYRRCGFVHIEDYEAPPSDPCADEIRMEWRP